MKKIVVLTIVLALAVGMPLLASEFTFGGDLDWGFISNFTDTYAGADNIDFAATFDVKGVIDDFNTASFSVTTSDTATVEIDLETAQLATDLGKALNLPIGFTSYAGWFNFGSQELTTVTDYNLDYVANFTGSRWQWGAGISLMGVLNLEAATDFDFTPTGPGGWLGANAAFGPVSAEVWYENIGADAFGANALISLAPIEGATVKAAVGFEMNLDADTYALGAGAKFSYGMFGAGVSFNGNDTDFVNLLGVEASVAPLANAGVKAGVLFNLPSATDVFNSFDVGVYYKAGASTWSLGYLFAPEGVQPLGDVNAPAVLAVGRPIGGGFYIGSSVDY